MFKKFINRIYGKLVRANRYVYSFYSLYKIRHSRLHRFLKPISWMYLVWLIFANKLLRADAKKRREYPESKTNVYPNFEKLASRLSKERVLSFNVFGTLLLRKVERPADLFDFIGYELGVNDYKSVRLEAEQEAKKRGQADLRTICLILEERYGIDATRAYETEIKAERVFCRANPYFLRLLSQEECKGKTIVAVCDTYLSSEFIGELLGNCGYHVDQVIVSCENRCSKAEGALWKIVREQYGKRGFIHIGDDYEGDIRNCNRAGLHAIGVPNLGLACCVYRDYNPRSAVRSLYSALVSTKLHCCGISYDPFYEHGYAYGGLLVYGFCSWLERLAKYRGYDCLIFLARDAEVFYNVYRKYFGKVSSIYLHTSRIAALKLVLPKYFNIFVDVMFERKLSNRISVGQALGEAELAALCADLPRWGLAAETRLDKRTIGPLKNFLYSHESEIAAIFRENKAAFESYSSPMLAGVKRGCIIDLGWCGSIYTALETYFREAYPDKSFYSAMLGVTDSDMTGYLLDSGKMDSYVFSYKNNAAIMIDKSQVMLMETMFSSEEPSTIGYAVSEAGAGSPVFGKAEEPNNPAFRQIRGGIYDFCEDYTQIVRELPFEPYISGAEAYAPLAEMLPNVRYNMKLFGELKANDDPNSEPIAMSRLLDEVGYTSYKNR